LACAEALFPQRESVQRDFAPRREAGEDAAAKSLCGSDGGIDREDRHTLIAFGGNNTSGPIDVATACNAHGGPHGRRDFETETFVATTLRGRDQARGVDSDCSDTLIVFRLGEVTRPGSAAPTTDFSPPLDSAGGSSSKTLIAFSAKDHGADHGDLAPTLRAGGHDKSHANAGVMPAIAGHAPHAVAFHENQRAETYLGDIAGSLNSGGGKPGQGYPAAMQGMSVRRLTPVECLRLMGFPDDYLDIQYRGKPAADGNKYRATGNSFAVPVVRWIGRRIQAVSD